MKNKIKKILITTLTLVFVLSISLLSGCFVTSSQVNNSSGTVIDKIEPIEQPIYSFGEPLAFSMVSEDSENEHDGKLVEARVLPLSIHNKLVSWSVSFVNANSEWATGKDVSDYVTVSPLEDNCLFALVKCLQPFGEQINLTVTSFYDSSKSATCTIDYYYRISECSVKVFLDDSDICTNSLHFNSSLGGFPHDIIKYTNKECDTIEFEGSDGSSFIKFGVGTMPHPGDLIDEYFTITLNDDLFTELVDMGLGEIESPSIKIDSSSTDMKLFAFDRNFFSTMFGVLPGDALWDSLFSLLTGPDHSSILITYNYNYMSGDEILLGERLYCVFDFDATSLIVVDSVEMNNGNVIL